MNHLLQVLKCIKQTSVRFIQYYSLGVSWVLCVIWMKVDYWNDPGLVDKYGTNAPGAFNLYLIFSLIELTALYLVLNPQWKRWKTARLLLTILFFWMWTILQGAIAMHGGGVSMIHLLWLLSIDIALIVFPILLRS
ncbi:MAG: hypothetical protein B0A82_14290 [Alkalinema sp. CACIAM 70d]|nr:MAG: hypothetical protein B0A82_14290 [Alkalinema sp. CACIAM 70d]